MDIGNSNKSIPITYETYKLLCLTMGISREWEIEFGYRVYLFFLMETIKKQLICYTIIPCISKREHLIKMSEHKLFMKKFKYINEMMGCACFPDLLSLKIFPDGKEITESMSAYNFFRNNKNNLFDLSDSSVFCIVVGDGCTPRTASLFAFRTKWNCFSIDPNMRWQNNERVSRLQCIKSSVENLEGAHFEKLALIHVHSHARLEESVSKFTADKRVVLSIPCCIAQERERLPDIEYRDESIWSPENLVKVWIDF